MKRRSVLLSDDTYVRLVSMKKVYGVPIQATIEMLAKEHLATLEERQKIREDLKDILKEAVKKAKEKIDRIIEGI